MSVITFWFVRHKPSGGYLPEPAGRMGRGGSHVEPVVHTEDPATTPRVFTTKRSATNALSSWLRGKVYHSSGYDGWDNEYYEGTDLVPVPSRKKDEMEIISVELVLP